MHGASNAALAVARGEERQENPLNKELRYLEEITVRLHQRMDALGEKLQPIIINRPTVSPATKPMADGGMPTMSPLAERVHASLSNLDVLVLRMESLHETLDI